MLALGDQIHSSELGASHWLAWFLADCVDPQFRDPARAAAMAKALVEQAPRIGDYWITLGIARYRIGEQQESADEYRAAIEALNKSIRLSTHYDSSHARFFLAMAHWRLGEKDLALSRYGEGVAQMETEYEGLWLRRNHEEARELLGLKDKKN
jgi:tetratricopeptide (TPR) repeat protein